MGTPRVEIPVTSVEDAVVAQTAGAESIELLDNVGEGGVTPSAGKLQLARRLIHGELHAIVRPRAGDFLYSDIECDVMHRDIDVMRQIGIDGVVLGVQRADGTVDGDRIAEMIELAGPMHVTFHAAFDYTPDPFEAIDMLADLGITRILSAFHGGVPLLDQLPLYQRLIEHAGDRLVFMPGGFFAPESMKRINDTLHPREIHCYDAVPVASAMQYRPQAVVANPSDILMRDYTIARADEQRLRAIIDAVR